MFKLNVKVLAMNGIVGGLYFVVTLALNFMSFGPIQFRLSEILVLLCFFQPNLIYGLTIGTFLSNLLSPLQPFDLIFGTLATLLSSLGICFMRRLLFASLFPIITNSLIVGLELFLITSEPFFIAFISVFISEALVICLGYLFFTILKNKKMIEKIFDNPRNIDFPF